MSNLSFRHITQSRFVACRMSISVKSLTALREDLEIHLIGGVSPERGCWHSSLLLLLTPKIYLLSTPYHQKICKKICIESSYDVIRLFFDNIICWDARCTKLSITGDNDDIGYSLFLYLYHMGASFDPRVLRPSPKLTRISFTWYLRHN